MEEKAKGEKRKEVASWLSGEGEGRPCTSSTRTTYPDNHSDHIYFREAFKIVAAETQVYLGLSVYLIALSHDIMRSRCTQTISFIVTITDYVHEVPYPANLD